jgi:hypothetical protein
MTHRTNRRIFALGAVFCVGLLLAPGVAQTPPPSPYLEEDVRHLIGIQNRMRVSLEQLPNHTCRMEVRRAHIDAKAREKIAKQMEKRQARTAGVRLDGQVELANIDIPLDSADVVALEVAIIGSRELYAFPDSVRFEDRSLASMIGHGTISTGSFAGYAKSVFVNGVARTKYAGEEVIDGEPVRRYDYEVDLFRSGFSVNNQGRTAVVPYHGSFWAAADTDELRRLTVSVDDIPVHVGVDELTTQIDYQTLRLDSEPFIVPQHSRLSMMLSTGVESINETDYVDCRAFVGSSTVSFDPSAPDAFYVARTENVQQVDLPAGLRVPVRLITSIDSETARVGTLVEAELTRDIQIGPELTVRQGSLLSGRLRQFEFYPADEGHYLLGVEFHELTFDAGEKRAELSMGLERVAETVYVKQKAPTPVTRREVSRGVGNMPTFTRTTVETYEAPVLPGVGVFYIRGREFELEPGLEMVWRTKSHRD